jgi:hypothetical protein
MLLEELLQDDDEALFEMANVYPEDTGLPFVVWISPKGRARHDARVKVARTDTATEFIASLSVRPEVRVMAGDLPAGDLALAAQWIELNREALLDYWDGVVVQTKHVLAALKPIDS